VTARAPIANPRLTGQARRRMSPSQLWAREAAAAKRRALEDRLAIQIRAHGLPAPDREYRFHPTRRWRFDFAWEDFRVAAEVDGGTWSGGRHTRGAGFERDLEKLNAATSAGWKVFRYTTTQVRTGYAVCQLRVELERAAWDRKA
jgi:very-short-patch-repair endonuclease